MIDNLRKRYEQLQGLLNTPANQGGGLLGNISQGALLGSAIYGQGIQGKDPFSALLPAVTQTAQIQQLLTPKQKDRKIVKAADGFNYYEDTGERVLPGVQAKPKDVKTKEVYDTKTGTKVFRTEKQLAEEPDRYTGEPIEPIQSKIKRGQENTLFGNYTKDKSVQGFNQSSTQLQKMLTSFEQGTGAGDVAGIFAFMKTLDPNSVVRESEFQVAEGTGGAKLASFEKAFQLWKKARKGQRLTNREKENFKSAAIGFYEGELSSLDNLRGAYEGVIQNQNLDSTNIFVDNDLRPKFLEIDGKKIKTPSGATLADYKDGVYFWKIPGFDGYYSADSRGRSK